MQSEERDFFRKIRQVTTVNPFSNDRQLMDLELTGLSSSSPTDEIIDKLTHKTEMIIERFLQRSKKTLADLPTEDSQLLHSGMLFRVFHRFCDQFDDHIREQVKIGDKPYHVGFATEFFHILAEYRFSPADSARFLALFYQMRRAFFFISRIAGESQCVKDLRKMLWNNIFTYDLDLYDRYLWDRLEDFSTILLGETGTGKGLAASAIGRSGYIPFDEKMGRFSESFSKTFISINLSQFPEQLIESELFGHKKGAFTGAVESHQGIFSQCSPYGSIFLDEIGDVSVPIQIKLLQVLQERTFTPVGSRTIERFKGRVIAATNKSLDTLRDEGEMRDDFYYRLCSDEIKVPPLKQRIEENPSEIDIILSHIIKKILGKPSAELCESIGAHIARNQPKGYPWSGNIRELEQCVRQILMSNSYSWKGMSAGKHNDLTLGLEQGSLTAQQLLAQYCASLYSKLHTYEAVAKVTELDRRTVKKYIQQAH